MKKVLALTLLMVMAIGFCATAQATTYLALGTGGTSGTYYALGADIAALWMANIADLDVTVQPTDASKDNIVFIEDGEIDLATVQNDAMAYAYEVNEFYGNEVFDGFYAIGTLYPEAVQCVVAADSDIHSISDLKGKNVSVGAQGSGTYMNAEQVLACGGLTMDDINPQYLSFAESATAFQDGQIDAAFLTSGVPNTAIVEITTKSPVRVLAPTEDEWTFLNDNYAYYVPYTIPAGTYEGFDEDATTITVKATLVCDESVSDDVAYAIVSAIFANADEIGSLHAKGLELSPEFATEGIAVPFAAGAARYFAEQGITVETVG